MGGFIELTFSITGYSVGMALFHCHPEDGEGKNCNIQNEFKTTQYLPPSKRTFQTVLAGQVQSQIRKLAD